MDNATKFLYELEKQEAGLARKFVERCKGARKPLMESLNRNLSSFSDDDEGCGFYWGDSPEGHRFWYSRTNRAYDATKKGVS